MPKPLVEIDKIILTSKQAADLLQISTQWLGRVSNEGWYKPESRGRWLLSEVIRGYLAYLKDESSKKTKTAQWNRVQEARAQEIERRLAREDRKIILLSEAMDYNDQATGAFLTVLSGLPAEITRNVRERKRIESIIDRARARLAERFKKIRLALETGEEDTQVGEED